MERLTTLVSPCIFSKRNKRLIVLIISVDYNNEDYKSGTPNLIKNHAADCSSVSNREEMFIEVEQKCPQAKDL